MSHFQLPGLQSQELTYSNLTTYRGDFLSSSGDSASTQDTSSSIESSSSSTPSPESDLCLPSTTSTIHEKNAAISLLGLVHGRFPETSALMQNMLLARDINHYVKQVVPFAANNDHRGQVYTQHLDQQNFETFSKTMVITYGKLCEKMEVPEDSDDEDDSDDEGIDYNLALHWHKYAKLIEKAKIGNCRELSIVGFSYGVEKLNLRNIEIIQILDGDHAFLVLGRDVRSEPENYRDWGDSAVICDTWAEACYPATKILNYLNDYKGLNEVNEKVFPILAPFDPSNQILDLLLSTEDIIINPSK